MKSLNVKKMAAVGAGIALVASSAMAAVTWSNLADDSTKTLKVNGVVYGAGAAESDMTAALALSNYIAGRAVTSTTGPSTTTCPEGTTEGSSTEFEYKNAEEKEHAPSSASLVSVSYDDSGDGLESLVDTTVRYSIDNDDTGSSSKENTKATESFGFSAKTYFDDDESVQSLVAEVASGDLNYTVSFADTVDFNADGEWTSGEWTATSSGQDVVIPFLGKMYEVYSVSNPSGDELVLTSQSQERVVTVGETLTSLKGKEGKTYNVTMQSVPKNTNQVKMALYDASTNALVYTATVNEGAKFATDYLLDQVLVKSVDDVSLTDDRDYEIELLVGDDVLTIKDGKGFPYDESETSLSKYDWKASVNMTAGALSSITLTNTAKNDYTDEKALMPGESAMLYRDFAAVRFDGLDTAEFSDYSTSEVQSYKFDSVDYEAGEAFGLHYMDDSQSSVDVNEYDHAVPFYMKLTTDEFESDNASVGYNANRTAEFTFDGEEYVLYIDTDNNKMVVVDSDDVEDTDTDVNVLNVAGAVSSGASYYKINTSINLADLNNITQTYALKDSDGVAITYKVFYNNGDDDFWFALNKANDAFTMLDENISFLGSDADSNGAFAVDANFYLAKESTMDDFINNYTTTSDRFTAGRFQFATRHSGNTATIYTNNDKDALVESGANGGSSVPFSGQVTVTNVQNAYDVTNGTVYLNRGDDDEVLSAYDFEGTKYVVNDDLTLTVLVSESAAVYRYYGYLPSGSAANSAECTTVPGEVTNTPYTGSFTSVITDAQATADSKYIVVGGFMVNELFAADSTVSGKLTEANNSVTELVNGNLYVAGWTAQDTTNAVDALIAALEADRE